MTVAFATGRSSIAARTARVRADDLGILIGCLLPLAAAALYRTYSIAVTPDLLEHSRQFGFVFVLAEMAIIHCAGRRGLDFRDLFARLDRWPRRALLLFVGTSWAGAVATSLRPSVSIAWTVIWLLHLAFGAAVFHLVREGRPFRVTHFAAGFACGALVLALLTAFHFSLPPSGVAIPHGMFGWGGAVPGFISHRLFGAWCAAGTTLLLALAWIERADARTHWLYPAIALTAGLAVWTGTRAAVLGVGAGLGAALLLAGPPATRRFWWGAPSAVVAAVVAGTLLNPYGDPSFMFIRQSGATANEFTSGRLDYWADALTIALRTPLLGAGAGATGWLVPLGGMYHVQPHNALVQFLLDWGVIPTVGALGMLGAAILRVHGRARNLRAVVPLVAMLDCLLAMSMVDGMLHFPRFVMLIVALLAICLSYQGTEEGDPVTLAPGR